MIDRFFDGLVQAWFGKSGSNPVALKIESDPLSLDIAAGVYRLMEAVETGYHSLTSAVAQLRTGHRARPLGCG